MVFNGQNNTLTRLIRACGSHSTTESLLGYVAENGMLEVCTRLVERVNSEDQYTISLIRTLCDADQVNQHHFINELRRLVATCQRVALPAEHYAALGLSPKASMGEVKQAYRKLCRKYHPDTAGNQGESSKERFVAITGAYRNILLCHSLQTKQQSGHFPQWNRSRLVRRLNLKTLKSNFYLLFFLAGGLVVFSSIFATLYNQRQMVAGLQKQSGTLAHHPVSEQSLQGDESHVKKGHELSGNAIASVGEQHMTTSYGRSAGVKKNTDRAEPVAGEKAQRSPATAHSTEVAPGTGATSLPALKKRDAEPVVSVQSKEVIPAALDNLAGSSAQPVKQERTTKPSTTRTSGLSTTEGLEPVKRPETEKALPVVRDVKKDRQPVQVALLEGSGNDKGVISTGRPKKAADSKQHAQGGSAPSGKSVAKRERKPSGGKKASAADQHNGPVEHVVRKQAQTPPTGNTTAAAPVATATSLPDMKKQSVPPAALVKSEKIIFVAANKGVGSPARPVKQERNTKPSGVRSARISTAYGIEPVKHQNPEKQVLASGKVITLSFDQDTHKPNDKQKSPESFKVSTLENRAETERGAAGAIMVVTARQVDSFVTGYLKAYNERNFRTFSRFFAADATENGIPFSKMASQYHKFFRSARTLDLKISISQLQQLDNIVIIKGRFTNSISYPNTQRTKSKGGIGLRLIHTGQKLLVKELTYDTDR